MKDSERDRFYLVVKDNELVQKAKFNLSATQQKTIGYLISKIKPTDKELSWEEIRIEDFCNMCGIDKNHFYTEFKNIVDDLDNKCFWIETKEKIFKFRWFSEVEIIKGSGSVRVLLNSNLKKYLVDLQKNFVKYDLSNILPLKSKYSIRLYEYFKSYEFQHINTIELEELKKILFAENYADYRNFRRRVLDVAIEEINYYTDLAIEYEAVKKGKKIIGITFHIKTKEAYDAYLAYRNTLNQLNKQNKQIEGQISLFDRREEEF